jgi:hypothetical protein
MTTTRPAGRLTPARRTAGPRPSPAGGDREIDDTPRTSRRRGPRIDLPLVVGLAAIVFTALYLIPSD